MRTRYLCGRTVFRKHCPSFFRNHYDLTCLTNSVPFETHYEKPFNPPQLTNLKQHKRYYLLRAAVPQWFISKTVTSFTLKVFLEYAEFRMYFIHRRAPDALLSNSDSLGLRDDYFTGTRRYNYIVLWCFHKFTNSICMQILMTFTYESHRTF